MGRRKDRRDKRRRGINREWDREGFFGGIYESSLLTKSPNPGVSTTLRRKRTPFSSISAEIALILTVWGTSTEVGPLLFLGEYRLALNKVFTNVDFPSPLSPAQVSHPQRDQGKTRMTREDNTRDEGRDSDRDRARRSDTDSDRDIYLQP